MLLEFLSHIATKVVEAGEMSGIVKFISKSIVKCFLLINTKINVQTPSKCGRRPNQSCHKEVVSMECFTIVLCSHNIWDCLWANAACTTLHGREVPYNSVVCMHWKSLVA